MDGLRCGFNEDILAEILAKGKSLMEKFGKFFCEVYEFLKTTGGKWLRNGYFGGEKAFC